MGRGFNIRRRSITYQKSLLGCDHVTFTRHALDRMKQRKITREDVYATIEKPDEAGLPADDPDRQHVLRKRADSKFAIHVLYELLDNAIRVITTYEVDLYLDKESAPLVVRVRKKPPSKDRKKGKSRKRGRRK